MIEPIVLEGSCRASESDSALTFGPSVSGKKTSSHKGLSREPYTCERLTQIRGGYQRLSAAIPVLQFDFTNPEVRKLTLKEFLILWGKGRRKVLSHVKSVDYKLSSRFHFLKATLLLQLSTRASSMQ